MAKRTRSSRRPAPAAPPVTAAADPAAPARPLPPTPPPPRPAVAAAGWGLPRGFDLDLPWSTWVLFRVVFFALHSVDAVLQLAHAPRYGAGGFNVSQLPFELVPAPTRAGLTFVYGLLAIVFALCAAGVALRVLVPLAAALYGYAYFVSQLDSYQHHYLMFLVLVVLAFVPSAPTERPPGRPPRLRSWALRLFLVQLGILYLWAAVAKVDPPWLDGTLLRWQIEGDLDPATPSRAGSALVRWAATTLGFGFLAHAILAVELVLAIAIWQRRWWYVALPLGVGLHAGIELVDLDIGLFSYFMIASYLLVAPERALAPLADAAARATAPLARLPILAVAGGGAVIATLGLLLVARHPLPLGGVAAVGAAIIVIAAAIAGRTGGVRAIAGRLAAGAAAAAVIPLVLASTDVAQDHFRTWAGASRRLKLPTERAAYEGLLAVEPSSDYAHYYLGMLDHQAGRFDAAIAHFAAAQRSAPTRERSYLGEADSQLAKGDRAAARAALERGLAHLPGHPALTARLGTVGAP
jgi:tetratricopeptide (TPR) repeat protein